MDPELVRLARWLEAQPARKELAGRPKDVAFLELFAARLRGSTDADS